MNHRKAASFLLGWLVTALMPLDAGMGAAGGQVNAAAWFPLVLLFMLLPQADYAIGIARKTPSPESAIQLEHDPWFRWLTWLCSWCFWRGQPRIL